MRNTCYSFSSQQPDDVTGSASRKIVSSLIGTNGVSEAPRTADSLGSRCSIGIAKDVVVVVVVVGDVVENLISVDVVGISTGN